MFNSLSKNACIRKIAHASHAFRSSVCIDSTFGPLSIIGQPTKNSKRIRNAKKITLAAVSGDGLDALCALVLTVLGVEIVLIERE